MTKHNITKEELESAIKVSTTHSETLRYLKLPTHGSVFAKIKKMILLYNIDTSHFGGYSWRRGKTIIDDRRLSKHTIEEIFSRNSPSSSNYVKKLIKKESLISYVCNKCKNGGEWMEEKLTLQLDHINGEKTDHRLENLRWLCPNCHSQTETYGSKNSKKQKSISDEEIVSALKQTDKISSALKLLGIYNGRNYYRVYKLASRILTSDEIDKDAIEKVTIITIPKQTKFSLNSREEINYKNRKVKNRPDKNQLLKLIWENPATIISKMYNVSSNTIKKWSNKDGIVMPPRGYWAKYKAGHTEECERIKNNCGTGGRT